MQANSVIRRAVGELGENRSNAIKSRYLPTIMRPSLVG
jgi:hypothetical protein